MSDLPKGAVVRIFERSSDPTSVLFVRDVEVNGVNVGLIAEDGVNVDTPDSRNGAVTVTLTLLPSQVVIEREQS